jgi:hypothetical protein
MHLHLVAGLFCQLGRDMEGLPLAFDQDRDLQLRMQLLAVRTATIRLATLALAFDERAGEHFAKRSQAAHQSAAEMEVAIEGHRCLPFIVVADETAVKTRERFAKMTSDRKGSKES